VKKNQIILIIVGVLILIGLVSYLSYQLGQKSTEAEIKTVAPDFLTSKVTEKWNALASGKVIEISGRNLTLRKDNNTLTISISETAKIYFVSLEEKREELESAQFENIKIGDEINVSVAIEEGDIKGETVMILSPK